MTKDTEGKSPTFEEMKQQAMDRDAGKKRIVATKQWHGAIEEVKFDDGTTMGIDAAVEFAEEFGIAGVNVGRARSGRKILRANPTNDVELALDNLPTYGDSSDTQSNSYHPDAKLGHGSSKPQNMQNK